MGHPSLGRGKCNDGEQGKPRECKLLNIQKKNCFKTLGYHGRRGKSFFPMGEGEINGEEKAL